MAMWSLSRVITLLTNSLPTEIDNFCQVAVSVLVSRTIPRLRHMVMGNNKGSSVLMTLRVSNPETPWRPTGTSLVLTKDVDPPTPTALAWKVGRAPGFSPYSFKRSQSLSKSVSPTTPCWAPVSMRPKPGVTKRPVKDSTKDSAKEKDAPIQE